MLPGHTASHSLGSTLSHPLTRHFNFSPPESLGPLLDGATLAPSSHRRVPIPMCGASTALEWAQWRSPPRLRMPMASGRKAIPEHRTTSLPQEVEAFRIRQHSAATAIGNRLQSAWHEERGTLPSLSGRGFQLIAHNHDVRTVCDCSGPH